MRMVTCLRVPGGGTPGQLTGWGNRCGEVQSSGWGKAKDRAGGQTGIAAAHSAAAQHSHAGCTAAMPQSH